MAAEFSYIRRVQFAETDMAGIMHFANYFRLMEETEHAFFRSIGLGAHTTLGCRVIGWPRVITSCEYFAPLRFEDEIELRLRITDLSAGSMTYEVDFLLGGRRTARGRSKITCCAVEDGSIRAIPIPDDYRDRIKAAVD